MRLLQNILIVIGTTALGTVLGIVAIGLLVGLMQRPGGEPWTQGFGQYVGGLVCGTPLGALAGLVTGLGWVGARGDGDSWGLIVWTGIGLGILAGAVFAHRMGMVGGNKWWIAVSLVTVAGGSAGGFLAGLGESLYRVAGSNRRL